MSYPTECCMCSREVCEDCTPLCEHEDPMCAWCCATSHRTFCGGEGSI